MSEWDTSIVAVENGLITLAFEDFLRILGNQPFAYTTAEIEDKSNEVNTVDKRVGKHIFNSTTGLPLWADGTTDVSTWSNATGAVAHTPS